MQKLINLVRQLDLGDIALPIMQRDYVWRPRKVEALLESLYKAWPIGSFYLWCPSQGQPRRTGGDATLRAAPVMYLLDGQQRLASLSRAIKVAGGEVLLPPDAKKRRPAISWRVFFDVETQRFFLKGRSKSVEKRIDNDDPALVALSDLILAEDPTGIKETENITNAVVRLVDAGCIEDTADAKNDVQNKLRRVASMLNVDVLCQEIETHKFAANASDEIKVAIEIFRRLNSGGTHLSAGDVAAAQLAQETTASVLGPMREFAKDKRCGALGLNFSFLTRALAIVRCGIARFLDLPDNWATGVPAIDESWETTKKSLEGVIGLVRGAGWTEGRWLPSANALLPVAYFASLNGARIAAEDGQEALRFLCIAAWAGAFGGSSETAIRLYVRQIQKAGPGSSAKVLTEAIPKKLISKVTQEDVLREHKTSGALMQIYLAYVVSQGAKSWPSGQLLAEASKVVNGAVGIEVHHLFPRKFVEQVEADVNVNTMANYAILTKGDNLALGDGDPRVAYGALSVEQKRFAAEQFIPFNDIDGLLVDGYEAFTKQRAKAIAGALNKFLGL